MIVIKFSGGLGNQLYQYSLYRKFVSMGIEVKGDFSYFESIDDIPKHSSRFLLFDIFKGIEIVPANKEDINIDKYKNHKLVRFLASKGLVPGYITEDTKFERSTYHPQILKERNAYIDGYWQSFRYFEDIWDELRQEFEYKEPLEDRNLDLASRIIETDSVSIHVRRGDYLANSDSYELLNERYYNKAIEYVSKVFDKPSYYIFSDDIEWCKSNLHVDGQYVDWNKGKSSYIDMRLMSLCNANIVANSTFSIWAAMMNRNSQCVIRPYKYTSGQYQKRDRWPVKWISIKY